MALRVLLADESSTIKKVFQLALQDFAVEVRPVNVGVDVVPVAKSFKPDIIFADVLLQKKSGYDVAAELKQISELKGIPVVLMWSGFLELDEDKFQASHANAQLEKPFDVTALRKLVSELVPRTQNQKISQFLAFPKMPEIEENKAPAAPTKPVAPEEDFKQVPIPKMKGADKYRVDLEPAEMDADHMPVDLTSNDHLEAEEEEFSVREPVRAREAAPHIPQPPPLVESDEALELADFTQTHSKAPITPQLTEAQLEKIIREQSAEIIESVVWKVVPDLAAQIIERELNRLLKERESQVF